MAARDRRRFLRLLGGGAVLVAAGAQAAERLGFAELYERGGVLGLKYSARLGALAGHEVEMTGYMAPPLKAESTFFVLTRTPLALCPFCQTDADWPADIVVVLLRAAQPVRSADRLLRVTGRLEVGPRRDPETGFLSQVRLVDARYAAS